MNCTRLSSDCLHLLAAVQLCCCFFFCVCEAEFENHVVTATKLDGYDGKEASDSERQWSFSGSLLYSITVITTIGKNSIYPHRMQQQQQQQQKEFLIQSFDLHPVGCCTAAQRLRRK